MWPPGTKIRFNGIAPPHEIDRRYAATAAVSSLLTFLFWLISKTESDRRGQALHAASENSTIKERTAT